MATDYAEFVALAQELIAENGREVSVVRLSSSPSDPDKPWKGPGVPTIDESRTVPAVFVPASGGGLGKDIADEELLKRVEQVALIAPTDISLENFTAIDDTDGRWVVDWVQVLRPGPLIVLYVFGVKK